MEPSSSAEGGGHCLCSLEGFEVVSGLEGAAGLRAGTGFGVTTAVGLEGGGGGCGLEGWGGSGFCPMAALGLKAGLGLGAVGGAEGV